MKILIEQQQYDKRVIEKLLPHYYYTEYSNGVQIPYVGYFYSSVIKDTIFILPKVFIIEGKAFGLYDCQDFIEDRNEITEENKKTIFSLSVWVYRAIKLYIERKQKAVNTQEYLQNVVSHHGDSSETMLDIVLSILKFHKEHQSLFTYITILKHSGRNKIHWQKTISGTQAIIHKNTPFYLNPKNKQKTINFDEELIVLFYSVLNYLNTEFHFTIKPIFGYELLKDSKIKEMIRSGKGTRLLRTNRRKYFTDEMVKLWNLLFAFFSESEKVENNTKQSEEAMMVRNFNLVFEDMIDCLVGDDSLSDLKNQKDGKIIDHIYRDHSLIDAKDDIYFIGDSKYYKEDNEVGQNSLYKQFTYAKNVIQYNMDIFNDRIKGKEKLNYLDKSTEGYNITPNFFIRGFINKNKMVYDNDMLTKDGKEKISYHFENRLFDRDTLILQSYNINFLFVLAAYVQGASQYTDIIRKRFREDIQVVLQNRYNFYAMQAKPGVSADDYLKNNFREQLGKIYQPYANKKYYSLALDKSDPASENDTILNTLNNYFIIKDCGLDADPTPILSEVYSKCKAVVVRQDGYVVEGNDEEMLVYVGFTPSPSYNKEDFINHKATEYHTGAKTPEFEDTDKIKYLLVNTASNGVFEITKVSYKKKDGNFRLFFTLGKFHEWLKDIKKFGISDTVPSEGKFMSVADAKEFINKLQ